MREFFGTAISGLQAHAVVECRMLSTERRDVLEHADDRVWPMVREMRSL